MSQAIVDPEELRRFAAELKRFNEDLRDRTGAPMMTPMSCGTSSAMPRSVRSVASMK